MNSQEPGPVITRELCDLVEFVNDYEVDLVPSLGRMGSYSVPVSTPRNVVDPSRAAPWRYCPQSHRQSRLPIVMTVKPTAASQMEYGGS